MEYIKNKYLYWTRLTKQFCISKDFQQGTLVLGYHQIGSFTNDPLSLAVSKANFSSQLKFLKKNFNVITPQQFSRSIINKKIIPKSVLITFDDGYCNNLAKALPILKEEGVVALFFITTNNIVNRVPFWWDKSKTLKEYHTIKNNPLLRSKTNINVDVNLLPLTTSQLKSLSSSKNAVIGAHTHTHPSLAKLSVGQQAKDIKMGLELLKKYSQQPIHFFSYPFGGLVDYDLNTINIVRKHFKLAFTAMPFVANYHFNKYELPRLFVGNYSGKKLGKIIKDKFPNYGK